MLECLFIRHSKSNFIGSGFLFGIRRLLSIKFQVIREKGAYTLPAWGNIIVPVLAIGRRVFLKRIPAVNFTEIVWRNQDGPGFAWPLHRSDYPFIFKGIHKFLPLFRIQLRSVAAAGRWKLFSGPQQSALLHRKGDRQIC